MSEPWKKDFLGNVATLQRGFDLPQRLRKMGNVPIVTSSGIEVTHNEFKVRAPGVVTGRYGTIGQVFYVSEDFWPLNTTLYVRDFHGNDPLFVSYMLRTINFHTYSGKSGVPGVNRNDLHEIVISMPPSKVEQLTIADALSDADTLIESIEQYLAKKSQIKQGVVQELFTGRRRLPGFNADWKTRRLSAICTMKSGEGITSIDIDEHSRFPCYGGNGLRGFTKRFTHDGSYALIGRQGALCGNISIVDGQFFASEHAIVVTPKKGTDIRWLSQVLKRMNLNQYSESSAQPGLSISKLLILECNFPPYDEQTAIANILHDIDVEIVSLETKLKKARLIKQGMMQVLLTGRIRLIDQI
ncbi:restriction endonuclease subunit S [Undibacterium parvum]|uniref:Type I restriction modification DNA specificity domain-containing protein n=2 Tax=Undibacterium TaxID=401469 RepID=A0A6M4A4M5_9BURK|nr:restriction endonuclease subunit S [Undibacterium parvum]AZP11216.1 restriction endonuclease subunit S [Undibacterium parvum]QJQ05740.1 hypothetical protein EJG51_007600 [Undibacterium piscinae]